MLLVRVPEKDLLNFQYQEEYATDKALRKHFVKHIAQHFPKGSADRDHIRRSFRDKSFTLNSFVDDFASFKCDAADEVSHVKGHL